MSRSATSVLVPIHRAGWPFIAVFAAISVGLWFLWPPLVFAGVVLTAWCVYFFRDPDRVTPVDPAILVSPADGVVQMIVPAPPPRELCMGEAPRTRISVFMNVFDVHVNRMPADGRITGLAYRPGRFLNASLDKASEHNERRSVRFTTPSGKDIAVVQIAGLVARRILCWVEEGRELRAGERFGMIRFGSRVDVYLDDDMIPLAVVGQRAVAGETVIARALAPGENAAPRTGEVR